MKILIYRIVEILSILELAIFARVILSWIDPYPQNKYVRGFVSFIDSLASPFRIIIPFGFVGLDLGPFFLILIIEALKNLLIKTAFIL